MAETGKLAAILVSDVVGYVARPDRYVCLRSRLLKNFDSGLLAWQGADQMTIARSSITPTLSPVCLKTPSAFR